MLILTVAMVSCSPTPHLRISVTFLTGIDDQVTSLMVDDAQVALQLWDAAGQERSAVPVRMPCCQAQGRKQEGRQGAGAPPFRLWEKRWLHKDQSGHSSSCSSKGLFWRFPDAVAGPRELTQKTDEEVVSRISDLCACGSGSLPVNHCVVWRPKLL